MTLYLQFNFKVIDRTSFFTIPPNEWWKGLSQLERITKHRADFILPLTNKKDIKFWKGDIQLESNEDESYEMIDEMLRDWIEEISESALDNDSLDVATTIPEYIAKKLVKRSKCKGCEKKLTVHDQDLQNDRYLTLLSRGGLSVLPKEFAEFVYRCFGILDFVEDDIPSVGEVTRSAVYVLKYYGP